MLSERLRDQTIALAGLTQSSCMVTHLALTGKVADDRMRTMVGGLFESAPRSAESVYGSARDISMGMAMLARLLRVPPRDAREQWSSLRQMLDMIMLAGQLMRRQDMLDTLAARLRRIRQTSERFGERDDAIYAQIASLYRDTLSTLPRQIKVSGRRAYLTRPAVVDRVRALLMSGVRSAVLWRQLGGRRRALLLRRRQIIATAERLM